jgi:hypothetical protein
MPTVTHQLTLDEALAKRICDTCYQKALNKLFTNTYEVSNLFEIGDKVKRYDTEVDYQLIKVEKIYEIVQSLRSSLNGLKRIRESVVESYFSKYYEKVLLNTNQNLKKYLESLEGKKKDIVVDVTMKLLLPEGTFGPDEENFDREAFQLFVGEDRYSSRNFSGIYTNWVGNLASKSPEERLQIALERSKEYKLNHPNQLLGLTFSENAVAGSSIATLVEREWRKVADEKLTTLVGKWEEKALKKLELNSPKIIALYLPKFYMEPYLNLIIDVFKIDNPNKESHIEILRAPEVVAMYLERLAQNSRSSYSKSDTIGIVDDINLEDDLVLLTASSLWNPDQEGVYKNFEAAISAAKSI